MFLLNDGSLTDKKPEIQTRKSYLRPIIKHNPALIVNPVVQDAKHECDINNIMKRFQRTGVPPELLRNDPTYGDFSTVPEFVDALNTISHAHNQFSILPSRVRARFENDPQKFLEFANDPKNQPELVELGLASYPKPTPAPEPQKVIIVNSDDKKPIPKKET